jgi:hypothetical protein
MKIKKMFNKWQLLAVTIVLLLSALVTSALPVLASSPPNPMLNN